MFIKITLLSERLPTVFNQTTKWSFFRVYSHVVEEVVPLSEYFTAALDIADKYLRPSASLRIVIFNISEVLRVGDTKLLFQRGEIYIITFLAFNVSIEGKAKLLSNIIEFIKRNLGLSVSILGY